MDINQQLQPIVAGILDNLKGSIEAELRDQISNEIVKKIADTEFNSIVSRLVEQQTAQRLNQFNFQGASDEVLSEKVAELTDQINKTIAVAANQQVNAFVTQKLAAVDLKSMVSELIASKLGSILESRNFPEKSIPHTSINFDGLTLTGDQIQGGIIQNFGSTGIEDRSSFVQMTLMDHATAFEAAVYVPEIKVAGALTVEGSLVINGEISADGKGFVKLVDQTSDAVKAKLDDALFEGFSDTIFKKIQTDGLDLNRITQEGRDVVKGNQLGYQIVDSNLRRLGVVNDLQTSGENLLSETVYVTKGRVGINTIDPTAVFNIWDQEVEITISKHAQDTGYISTPRYQKLILGANNKENITLDVDGSVKIDNLSLGGISMSSAGTVPNYPGTLGQLVWNSNPGHGGAIGWVCLGATQWAKFGTVE